MQDKNIQEACYNYRVKAVTRYIITKHEKITYDDGTFSGGCFQYGEFENLGKANETAICMYESHSSLVAGISDHHVTVDLFKSIEE